MSDTGTAVPRADGHHGLRRSLGFRDLVVYGLLFIAPMAPVGVFGTLDARSHGAVALVYLIATVAMAFTAFSYAQMVRVVPQAGSVFAYARVALGNEAGFVAGWMAMLDYLLIPAVAYLFSGIAMEALVPEVSRWVWTALAVVVTTLLNLWGVRAAARVGFAVLAMEIVVLLVFVVCAIVVLARDGAERGWLSPLSGDGTQGAFALSAVLGAVSIAVLSYLGFDAIATFAEEVTGGSAKVAHAVLLVPRNLAGVLFVRADLIWWRSRYDTGPVGGVGPRPTARAGRAAAFYDAVQDAPWRSGARGGAGRGVPALAWRARGPGWTRRWPRRPRRRRPGPARAAARAATCGNRALRVTGVAGPVAGPSARCGL
ncbi:hypothetical protein SGLAM104S_04593 [Streptomyces glaucescens]